MMVRIGNFFFRYRNGIFPLVMLLLFVPEPRVIPNDTIAAVVGILVALMGQSLRAVTIGLAYIIRGGRQRQVYATELVQGGVFAHCRNPLYVGNLLVIFGLAIIANSWVFFLLGIPFFLFAYRAIVAAEENFLSQKFGPEFTDYCQRVSRFVPNLSGFGKTWEAMEFKWRRLIVKEYGSTYIWMVTACALILQHLWRPKHSFQNPEAQILFVVLGFLTVAYLTARILKKSRILVAD
jgi:protein-S-isoprenylcysteine O-methyltransferase Ste14